MGAASHLCLKSRARGRRTQSDERNRRRTRNYHVFPAGRGHSRSQVERASIRDASQHYEGEKEEDCEKGCRRLRRRSVATRCHRQRQGSAEERGRRESRGCLHASCQAQGERSCLNSSPNCFHMTYFTYTKAISLALIYVRGYQFRR